MRRLEVAVLAAAIAAVGAFVIRSLSETQSTPVGIAAPGGRDAGRVAAAGSVPEDPQAAEGSAHEGGQGAGGHERQMDELRARRVPAGRPNVIGGAARSERSSVAGRPRAAGRRRGGGESGATIADTLAPRRLKDRDEHRRELVELLGSQPRTQNRLFADPDLADEPKEGEGSDVALHLPLVEDVRAEESVPIEETGIDRADEGEGMTFTEDAVLAFPDAGNASGNGGTISLEIDPAWHGSDETNNAFVNIRSQYQFENRLQLVKNGKYLRFILADDTGHETGVGLAIGEWQPGERHRVTATWGDGVATLYVDGRFVGEAKYEGQLLIPPGTPMFVGSDHAAGYSGADATLRDFTVYRRPLSANEALAR